LFEKEAHRDADLIREVVTQTVEVVSGSCPEYKMKDPDSDGITGAL
jgi:hypothetical protein